MDERASGVLVLYASATGTAYAFACDLSEHLDAGGCAVECRSVADVQLSALAAEQRPVVWLVATAGQGAVPPAMAPLWTRLLQRRLTQLQPPPLAALRVAVLGLGDATYALYNAAARRLAARLTQLGAAHWLPLALCDAAADDGPGPQYALWRAAVLARLCVSPPRALSPLAPSPLHVEPCPGAVPDAPPPAPLLLEHVRVTPPHHWNDVRRLVLAVSSVPGDIVWLCPSNEARVDGLLPPLCLDAAAGVAHVRPVESVAAWMRRCAVPDTLLRVRDDSGPPEWWHGRVMALSHWLTLVFDLWAVAEPARALRLCAHYSTLAEPALRQRVAALAAAPFGADARDYVTRECRSTAELLDELHVDVAALPAAALLGVLPRLVARPYSVAHAGAHSTLLVSLQQRRTPALRVHTGRVSAMLQQQPGAALRVARVAAGALAPLAHWAGRVGLLVTAGTGAAGVTSFLAAPRPLWRLYHGCRARALDAQWLPPLLVAAAPMAVHWAESRVPAAPHRYVWHALLADAPAVWAALWAPGADAFVAVVGSARMARDVDSALATVAKQQGGVGHDAALAMVRALHSAGRVLVDVWA